MTHGGHGRANVAMLHTHEHHQCYTSVFIGEMIAVWAAFSVFHLCYFSGVPIFQVLGHCGAYCVLPCAEWLGHAPMPTCPRCHVAIGSIDQINHSYSLNAYSRRGAHLRRFFRAAAVGIMLSWRHVDISRHTAGQFMPPAHPCIRYSKVTLKRV